MSERRSELKAVAAAAEEAVAKERDLVQATQRVMEGWSQINGRLVAMSQNNLRAAMSAADQLRQCQNPADMLETQMRLARESYDQYMEDARQIGEIMTRMSSEAMGSLGLAR